MKIFIYASMLAVVLCQEFNPLPKGKTCPDLPLGELYKVLDDCRGRDEPHCLTDDRHRHGLVCVEERDIQTGKSMDKRLTSSRESLFKWRLLKNDVAFLLSLASGFTE